MTLIKQSILVTVVGLILCASASSQTAPYLRSGRDSDRSLVPFPRPYAPQRLIQNFVGTYQKFRIYSGASLGRQYLKIEIEAVYLG